jgi:hypothetical protein
VVAYHPQLKVRAELSGEPLQEFAAAIQQLVHCALVGLPEDHIQKEVAYAFIDRLKDW